MWGESMATMKDILIPKFYFPLILIVFAMIIPILLPPFPLHVAIMILLFAYLGTAWNILCGYTGKLAWGHAAFFGIGAYTSTALYMFYKITPWIGMLLGALLAAGYGALCGAFVFRFGLGGHYLVIATIALAEIVRVIFINWAAMGGAWGLLMPVVPDSWYDFQFHKTRLPYYYIALLMLLTILFIEVKLVKSRFGYYFISIREDEVLAESLGINTFKYKLLAMIISAALTAFGGTFYAQYVLYIAPDTVMPVGMSTDILIGPVVGGMGTIGGPIIGAMIIQPIHELTRAYVIAYTGRAGLDYVVAGLLMILVTLLRPRGVIEWVEKAYNKILQALPSPREGYV
jgi:branched-chain amino acid transport system permease protein